MPNKAFILQNLASSIILKRIAAIIGKPTKKAI